LFLYLWVKEGFILILPFSLGSTREGYIPFADDKIKRSVSVSSGISGFTSLGSVVMSNADTGSSNVSGSL